MDLKIECIFCVVAMCIVTQCVHCDAGGKNFDFVFLTKALYLL